MTSRVSRYSSKTTAASAYASYKARLARVRAYNQNFLSSQSTLASTFSTVQISLSDGMAQIAAQKRVALAQAELNAKIDAMTSSSTTSTANTLLTSSDSSSSTSTTSTVLDISV